MLQAIVKKGKVFAAQVPAPNVSPGSLLIRVIYSCISPGTELVGIRTSGKTIIRRILNQPEAVAKALNLVRSEGIAKVLKKVRSTSGASAPTGYSIAGVVVGTGEGVTGYAIGDSVAAAGAGKANHAEFVEVTANLVVRIPNSVSFRDASTVALGAIAMQGVRRCEMAVGEFCVVFGAGPLGLIAIQILRHAGARVIALDIDDSRVRLARDLGAEVGFNSAESDTLRAVENLTGGYGADAVLIATSTSSNVPISQSFAMCKKKGRVVLVGVTGLALRREDMYAKELDLRLSTSYGPGRYDKNYEEKGLEYPYAYVRWTENRNMAEYLRLLKTQAVRLDKMIHQVYAIENVGDAFRSLAATNLKPILVVLKYGDGIPNVPSRSLVVSEKRSKTMRPAEGNVIRVGIVGAGAFATNVHLPNIADLPEMFRMVAVVDNSGLRARTIAEEAGARLASTDIHELLGDKEIQLVMITTRHDSHAALTLQALKAGKHVFVEKPLATNRSELESIAKFYSGGKSVARPILMVGFNRRFSRYATEIKRHTERRINPLFIHYRMNAGHIPHDHWIHESGGRIIGEACHAIDLMTYFTNSTVKSVSCESITPTNDYISSTDNKAIVLKYDDGSVCTIEYFAVGSKALPKEYMEVHFDGKTIILDDFKQLKGYGVEISGHPSQTSDKGHVGELKALYRTLSGVESAWPIALWDMIQTTEVALTLG